MFDPKLLIQGQGTLNYHYLDKLEFVLKNALSEYPRTLAIRIDLHLSPSWFNNDMPFCAPNLSSDLMARFTRSLMAQIDSYRQQLTKHGKRAHPCKLRYYWVRERETSCSSHYHALLFVNKDLFWLLGSFNSENHTLSSMIQKAWLSALRLKRNDEYRALVHFPDNATYVLDRNQPDFTDHYNAFVYRASYLAKERSKAYSVSDRSIGYSQK